MTNGNYFEENGYKWSYEKTDETPYYYDMKFKGRIWCDHALFRMLRSMDEAEYKRRDKESRCIVINKKGLPVKCRHKCSTECPFGPNHSRTGAAMSMEALREGNSHIDFVDDSADPRRHFDLEELERIFKEALDELSQDERLLYISTRIKGAGEREVAKRMGISQPAVHKRLLGISKTIEEKMKSFLD